MKTDEKIENQKARLKAMLTPEFIEAAKKEEQEIMKMEEENKKHLAERLKSEGRG